MVCYFSLTIVGFVLVVSSALGDNLVATRVSTTLPVPMRNMAPYYDGESDFIYLLGGRNYTHIYRSIWRFDIHTETIEELARLPQKSYDSPLEADSTGNLIYMDSTNFQSEIYLYDINNNFVRTVGELPLQPIYTASTKNSAGNVLLVGGHLGRDIMEVNVSSENVQTNVVGQFPHNFFTATAVKVSNNTALVFGNSAESVPYLELDLTNLQTEDVAQSSFPPFQPGMTATKDRNFVYLFGGNVTRTGLPANGIIKLDPTTHDWEFLQVQYFPIPPGMFYNFAPEVIWVEKLNRVYMFGGGLQIMDTLYNFSLDDIYYIDMNPVSISV